MTDVSPHTPLPVAAVKSTASKSASRTSRESGERSNTQGTETEALLPVREEGWYDSAGGASCVLPWYHCPLFFPTSPDGDTTPSVHSHPTALFPRGRGPLYLPDGVNIFQMFTQVFRN
ncbi:hypothetical protein ElyMa_001189500 [Elysia marginata]|uniref:CTNNB1 binding N-teminal domain-containing protein n=1 Tax=Elysia marginata TaxID=1093978 RepID=A0AAV4I685_9GAST|nr:hypothetical protein ElyMa_001189500 [Elysia marginata]